MHLRISLILSLVAIFPSLSIGVVLTSGRRESSMALAAIVNRQTQLCTPVNPPVTCAKSCGAGNIECVAFPNCYNPSQGETCCSNGNYCSAGFYCSDVGCCPNGSTLASCGATQSLSVIPPTVPDSTASDTMAAASTTAVDPLMATTAMGATTTDAAMATSTTDVAVVSTTTDTAMMTAATTTSPTTTATTTPTPMTRSTSAAVVASIASTPGASTTRASQSIATQTANIAPRQSQAVLGLLVGGMGLAAFL